MEILQPPIFLPDELLESIADGVDSREDLLALALTCSAFCRVIIPERLHHRSVTISITNTDYLTRLSQKPHLIEHVYQVNVVNTTIPAPLSLHYGEPLPNISWPKTTNTPLDLLDQLKSALALCPNLRCLRLHSGLQDSYRMSKETANWLLSPLVNELGNDLRGVCLDITRFHTSSAFSLWEARNLNSLELIISGVDLYDWNDLCGVLERSPNLETLSIPSISHSERVHNEVQIKPLPRLPRLKRLSTPVEFNDPTIEQAFYSFLHANPSIEDLRWMSPRLPGVDEMPLLPNLRRMRPGTASAVFLQRFLLNKAPCSIKLKSLECYRASMHGRPLHLLDALDPAALRVAHMQDGSLSDIKTLAAQFPNIEELMLPYMHGFAMREPQGIVQRLRESVALTSSSNTSKRTYALLDEIVPFFPALRRICHVDVNTGDTEVDELLTKSIWWSQSPSFAPSAAVFQSVSTGLLHIRRSYPRLLSVNGWKLEEGMEEKVELVRSVTGMQYLGMVAPQARFWLGKEGFRMGFVEAGDKAAV